MKVVLVPTLLVEPMRRTSLVGSPRSYSCW